MFGERGRAAKQQHIPTDSDEGAAEEAHTHQVNSEQVSAGLVLGIAAGLEAGSSGCLAGRRHHLWVSCQDGLIIRKYLWDWSSHSLRSLPNQSIVLSTGPVTNLALCCSQASGQAGGQAGGKAAGGDMLITDCFDRPGILSVWALGQMEGGGPGRPLRL